MISIRPPQYFPRIEEIALLDAADRYVMADTFQYVRRARQNRTKLRNPDGWQWITIPLASRPARCPIAEAPVENQEPWQRKHWRALEYNYRSAPYFEYYERRFRPMYERDWDTLADLACASIELVVELLEVPTELIRSTQLPGRPESLGDHVEQLEVSELVTTAETAPHDQERVEVPVHVIQAEPWEYSQNFDGFEPEMSILDLLFNYGPESLMHLRAHHEVVPFTSGAEAD